MGRKTLTYDVHFGAYGSPLHLLCRISQHVVEYSTYRSDPARNVTSRTLTAIVPQLARFLPKITILSVITYEELFQNPGINLELGLAIETRTAG